MEREKKPKHFIQQPEYPGGPKELSKFVYSQLRYPEAALKAGVEGSVLVEYDIDYKGNVVDTRVLQSLGHGCDEEACRVIRLLKFSVGRNRGVRVLFHKKMPVRFKLPAQKPQQAPQQVNYQYVYTTPSPIQAETAEPAPASSYTYTITLPK
ncbi:MAG: energy transducer TonB [Saprospiraceae bacterium]|nr:energy transducer TonB [Saprospiraceae bacterium]